MPEGRSEVIPPSSRAATARAVLREVQDALGIPWVPESWVELTAEPQVANVLWASLRPVVTSGAFLRESLALLSQSFADLADAYGPGEGVSLPEADRRGILLDLDALLYGDGQLLLQSTLLRLALREEAVGRPGPPAGTRPRSAYRRRAVEAVDESAAPSDVQRLFEDVSEALNLPAAPEELRVVAKWMGFLEPAWGRLKRWRESGPAFFRMCGAMERRAEAAARRLSPAVSVDDRELWMALGDIPARFEALERLLDIRAASWPAIILMGSFFRVEAAVHPEHPSRLHSAREEAHRL